MPAPGYASGKRGKTIHLQSVINAQPRPLEPVVSMFVESEEERDKELINDSYLAQLYEKLGDRTLGYQERAQAAVEVRQRLKEFQADFIPSLWYQVYDLTGLEVPHSVRRIALELFVECIKACDDADLKSSYRRSALGLIRHSLDKEGMVRIDANCDLMLVSLQECCLVDGVFLRDDDSLYVVDSLINRALRKPKQLSLSFVSNLVDIVVKLKGCLRETQLLEILCLQPSFLTTSGSKNSTLVSRILDYLVSIIRNNEASLFPDYLPKIALLVVRLWGSSDARHITQLNRVFHELIQSKLRQQFLSQLQELSQRNDDWLRVIELYAFCFVDFVCCNGDSENEVSHLLSRLALMKHNEIYLRTMIKLMKDCDMKKEGSVFADSSTWQLTGRMLVASDDVAVKTDFIITFLQTFGTNSFELPSSIDSFVQLICKMSLPIDLPSLISFIRLRGKELCDIASFIMITQRCLSPTTAQPYSADLFDIFCSLLKEHKISKSITGKDLLELSNVILLKSRALEYDDRELSSFSDLMFLFLQHLPVDDFSNLIDDCILFDINAILSQRSRRRSVVDAIGGFVKTKQPISLQLLKVNALVQSLVKCFIWSAKDTSGDKTIALFDTLCSVYSTAKKYKHEESMLMIARAMVRIRRNPSGFLYFINPTDAVGISTTLGRFKDRMLDEAKNAKWCFPEKLSYIDESLLFSPNERVRFEDGDEPRVSYIDISKWLSLAIGTIKAPVAWDIFSYLLTHLCSQLSEVVLFRNCPDLINELKDFICEQFTSKDLPIVELEGAASRCDLHSALVRNLSSVLAYHPYEAKGFADEIISATVIGLALWEKTLIPVLHLLCVSCYEVPLSVQKNLSPLLLQIQKRMTSCCAVSSILEFFMALKNSPAIIANLTLDELKRVFAIVFKLIEYSIDLKLRFKPSKDKVVCRNLLQTQNQEYQVETSSSTEAYPVSEEMAEFVEYQSFMVLTCWFLCLNVERKKELYSFVMGGLQRLQNFEGLEYDVLAHMDFISRSQFISQDHWNIDESKSEDGEDDIESACWIHNSTLISIKSKNRRSVITVWKPTCTLSFAFEPQAKIEQPTYNLFGFESVSPSTVSDNLELSGSTKPKALLTQLCYLLGIPVDEQDRMLRVPDDPIIKRSINSVDRIPNKELMKTGIIYIGKGQHTEEQVLSNYEGSHQYNWFLSQMGYFIKLSEKRRLFYIGGLDEEVDGEYGLIWNDEVSHIAFHTVTLFPREGDLSLKKRHVGNNFVNIFYDESGLPDFNFNIIKSQFTFISIVITPQPADNQQKVAEHYKIKLYRRTGTPGLFSCAHFKVLTRAHLARYVLHISQMANALAQKMHEQHSPFACSAWGIRFKHLSTIRERVSKFYGTHTNLS